MSKHCSDEHIIRLMRSVVSGPSRMPDSIKSYASDSPDFMHEPEYSALFLNDVREQYRGYLESTGGDISAADKCMRVMLSRYRTSSFTEGFTPYALENYPFVGRYKTAIHQAMNNLANEFIMNGRESGELGSDVSYLSSELVANEQSIEEDHILTDHRKRGINYVELPNGKKVYTPTYMHVIHYSESGMRKSMIIGLFNPSEVINE